MGRREEGWDPPTHILFKERRDGGQEARDTKRVTWENHYYVGVSLFEGPFSKNTKQSTKKGDVGYFRTVAPPRQQKGHEL